MDYSMTKQQVQKEFLLPEELKRWENVILEKQYMKEDRDVFIFCCYTGLAYIDYKKLCLFGKLIEFEGMKWIMDSRVKSKSSFKVPLLPRAEDILNKYQGKFLEQGSLLPLKSNQKFNLHFKEIAEKAAIDKPVTFHMARHTFATTITMANGVDISTISQMMGNIKCSIIGF